MTGPAADESRRLQQVTNDVDALHELMNATDARVQRIATTVDQHTVQLERITDKLIEHDQRFEKVEASLGSLTTQVGELRDDVREIVAILKT